MRTVFMGTPRLSVPALRALHATTTVVGVVCQPDRPAGRGLTVQEPPVKQAARDLGLQVHQPVKVKTGSLHEWLAERAPDVAIVLAYGRILPPAVLAAPRRGCMNLHASLLPKYRGAAPVNWAIIHGETETGISLMQIDEGLDTGPVYCRRVVPIGPEMTAGQLAEKLAQLAAATVLEDLPQAVAGRLPAVPQDDAAATYAPLIQREHRRIDWSASATRVANLVRGLAPSPTAFTSVRGKLLKVHAARATGEPMQDAPGTVRVNARRELLVSAADGAVQLLVAQLEGRKPLAAPDLVNGRVLKNGDLLGE